MLAYLWISSQLWAVGYEVRRLEKTLAAQIEHERILRVEVAELSRHERVEERARLELGLDDVALERVVFAEELE